MYAKNHSVTGLGVAIRKFGTVLLAVALMPAVSSAQETTDESKPQREQRRVQPGLEEITVTARRREESLMEVPVTITALTARDTSSILMRDILSPPCRLVWMRTPRTTPLFLLRGPRGADQTVRGESLSDSNIAI
jgi:hypothetical protein